MKWPGFYSTPVVATAVGVVAISTLTMSILSYQYSVGRENLVETTLVQSNISLARQNVDRI